MKTEHELEEIMRRFGCSREEAETAPPGILELFYEEPSQLSEEDMKRAQEIAKKFVDGELEFE